MKSLLINPFSRIAGFQSFAIGLMAMLLTCASCHYTGTHYYGLLKINFSRDSLYQVYLIENIIHWLAVTGCLLLLGKILSRRVFRTIDLIGTLTFARIPLLIVPILRVLPAFWSFSYNSVALQVIIVVFYVSSGYMVLLAYNAYAVSTNLQGNKRQVSFFGGLISAEIITQITVHYILKL